MDIPIYVGVGLLVGGYFLNKDGKQARDKIPIESKTQEELLEIKKAGGHNIYDNGYFQKVRKIEDEKVVASFEKGFDPINTNVIPYYFNTINETQIKRVKNPHYDRNLFNKELTKIMKTTPIELTRLEPVPNDLTDVNQDGSLETGGWNGSSPKALYAETELNKNWATLVTRPSTQRGDNNREPEMTHNNMVPFFGGSVRQNMDIDNRMMGDKLETFTGQFKLDQNHKMEVTPLFAPVQQNLDQIMEPRELDRYVTTLQSRNNELPFEQMQVGPGLNDGYTARPSGGFHNPLRVLPKTIDQLLVNPRVVKEGRVIRGKDPVDKRTARQRQYKYRPELLVTNFNGERNFTTTGVTQKPRAREGVVRIPTNRQKSKQIMGHAMTQSGSQKTPAHISPKGKISLKQNFRNTPFRNAAKVEAKNPHNNQQLRYENRDNERSTTQVRYGTEGHCYTNCKPEVEKGQTYQQDRARKTRNESYVLAPNPTGYVNTTTHKGKAYDPKDQTRTTIRETTEQNSHQGHVDASHVKGVVHDASDVMKTTIKETTEISSHMGHVQVGDVKGRAYDPHDLTRTTIRETNEVNSHNGFVQTDGVKSQVYDPFDLMKTTIREMTEDNGQLGVVSGPASSVKGRAYDPQDVARTTTKETTENTQYLGTTNAQNTKSRVYDPNDMARTTVKETTEQGDYLGTSDAQHTKGLVYDPFDCAPTTHRETTEQNDYLMPVENTTLQNGKGYQTSPTDVKNTQRQVYSEYYHVGGASQADAPANPQLYDSAYNMRQSNVKEVIAEGRQPTLSGVKLTSGKTDVSIEIKKLEGDRVNHYSAMRAPINCNQRKPMSSCEMTSMKNNLPPSNTYFDPLILKAFKECPLAQSVHSWA
jgi:hypothetical protein